MILNTVNRKLQVVLTTAKTTSDMSVLVDYSDLNGENSTDDMQLSTTNGTTAVDICFAPAEGVKRDIKGIQINNQDTASKVVRVSLVDNGTAHRLVSATLQIGDTLGYTDAAGWYVIDTNGNHKTNMTTATNLTLMDAVEVNVGSSGTAGTLDIFPATAAKGKVQFVKADNTNNDTTTVSFDAMGQATTVHVGDLGAAADYLVRSTAQITLAEADVLDGATAGTVVLSKAVVVDANKDVSAFRNVGLVNLDAGSSGAAGTIDVFPATAARGKFTLSCTDQTGDTAVELKPGAMGQATVITMPDPAAATADVVLASALAYRIDSVAMSPMKWVDVAVTAAALDAAGTANVIAGVAGDQYKIRGIRLVGGGTNYGAGGDRNISLTDGTTTWTTIANADIESAPAATLEWGDAKVPFLTGTSNTASVAGQAIRFAYSGGTTDHGGVGSITFSVCLEKVA